MKKRFFLFLILLSTWSTMAQGANIGRVLILNPYSRDVEPFCSAISGFRSTLALNYGQPLDIQDIPLDLARTGGTQKEAPLVAFIEDRVFQEPVHLVVPIGPAGVQFVERHGERLRQNTSMAVSGAMMAIEILDGQAAGEIRPLRPEAPTPTYDGRGLRRWIIPEFRLFRDSVVLFLEPRFWDRYRWPLIGIVCFALLESVLIMGLLANRRRRIRGELEATLVADISSKFINLPAHDIDREIIDAQGRLCRFLDVDAIVLWQTSGERSEDYLATHACQLQGGPMPSLPFRQEDFPWVRGEMNAGRIVLLANLDDMPNEAAKDKESARRFGIRSSLTIPLYVGGGLPVGVLAFNAMRSERAWPQALVKRLQLVAQIFANALARKRAELALRESELRLSLATDSAGAGLWVLELNSGEFWANEKARRLFGYADHEFADMARFQASVVPEDWPKVAESIQNSIKTGAPVDVEYRIKLPDAAEKWIVSRGRPSFHDDGAPQRLIGLSMDISERKRSENRAHQLSLAVEQSPVLVIITDLDGKIVYVNRRFSEVTGYSLDESIGRSPRILKSGKNPASTYREMWACITHGKTWQGELHNRKKNGELYWEQAVISPLLDEKGQVTHFVGVKEDITEQKRAEEAVRAAEKQAEELRRDLTHLSRVNTLGALSGSLAHELNQPLGIILSNAEAAQELLLQDPPDVEEVQAILADIIAADRRAGEVIVRLRALLKRGDIALRPLSLNQVIEEVLHLLRADLIARGISIECDLAPCLPQAVGDRIQLQQLVLNLILNAAEAMETNPPGERRIHLRTVLQEPRIRASVRDEGAGLTTDAERLFQPFYTTKTEGLGLGLSICWSIVAAHHGQLWAEPHPERGAVFLFELPVEGSLDVP
ncbi:MAG: PAS domain S-box protein [Verrucomicrobiales bacterium]